MFVLNAVTFPTLKALSLAIAVVNIILLAGILLGIFLLCKAPKAEEEKRGFLSCSSEKEKQKSESARSQTSGTEKSQK